MAHVDTVKIVMTESPVASERLSVLSAALRYSFQNEALLIEALTHSSAAMHYNKKRKPSSDKTACNERLEFLGDSVLGLVLSTSLLLHPDQYREGKLSKIRASLVNEKALAKLSIEIGLDQCIFMSQAEEKGGAERKTLSWLMQWKLSLGLSI